MYDDIIKPKIVNKKKIRRRSGDLTVPLEFLEDLQEILWDLAAEPCIFCGQETGTQHKDSCSYALVMQDMEYYLLKHRRS